MIGLAAKTIFVMILTLCLLAGCGVFVASIFVKQKKVKRKVRISGTLLLVFPLLSTLLLYVVAPKSVVKIDLPEGKLCWATERPSKARFCVPAAYTDKGHVLGDYRFGGKTYHGSGSALKHYVSLADSVFYVDKKWHTDLGFQQHPLVVDGVPIKFGRDGNRRRFRRALCKNSHGMFVMQSNFPVTLTDFAIKCSRYASNAVNLDMGNYAYGYTHVWDVAVPLTPFMWFNRENQTNWLFVK